MQDTVLILGARGRFGLAAARAFARAGWRVVGQMRPGAMAPQALAGRADVEPIEWRGIDPHDTTGLAEAAPGASVVVHALNPSAYTDQAWQAYVLPLTDAAIAVAHALNATLMMPGNVYNFGPTMPAVLQETTPQLAQTIKGQLRVVMEQRLRDSGVRSVVIRAGDYFGSGRGTWFDASVITKVRKGVLTYPGHLDVATAWAYLPDLAATFVAVAAKRSDLVQFEVFHFQGISLTGQQWLDALKPVAREQGWVAPGGDVRFKRLPWAMIRIGAWVNPSWAATLEMRYLWDTQHRLDDTRLIRLIGREPRTPLDQALRQSLTELGFLPAPVATAALMPT